MIAIIKLSQKKLCRDLIHICPRLTCENTGHYCPSVLCIILHYQHNISAMYLRYLTVHLAAIEAALQHAVD